MKSEWSSNTVTRLFIFCVISFIPLGIIVSGGGPGFGQEDKGGGKDQKRAKEAAMAEIGQLTEEEGKFLLKVARRTIERELFGRKTPERAERDLPSIFHERRGAFVTLTIKGGLRGCIGHIIPQESLIEGITVNAINAAFRDPQFRPLTKEE